MVQDQYKVQLKGLGATLKEEGYLSWSWLLRELVMLRVQILFSISRNIVKTFLLL